MFTYLRCKKNVVWDATTLIHLGNYGTLLLLTEKSIIVAENNNLFAVYCTRYFLTVKLLLVVMKCVFWSINLLHLFASQMKHYFSIHFKMTSLLAQLFSKPWHCSRLYHQSDRDCFKNVSCSVLHSEKDLPEQLAIQ